MDDRPATPASSGAGFDTYFQREVEPALDALEEKRASHVLYIKILLAVGALFLTVILFKVFTRDGASEQLFENQLVGLAVFALMFIPLVAAFLIYHRLTRAYKGVLTGKICDYFGFEFEPRGFDFPIDDFAAVIPPHRRKQLEDRIAGRHDGTNFALCEARFMRRSGGKDSKDKEVFRGLLLAFELPEPFKGETVLTPDWGGAVNLLESWRQKGERVLLEGIEFEETFEVYSTDPLEARAILTPLFMERVMQLAEYLGSRKSVGLAFQGNRLLLAIRHVRTESRFEAGHVFSEIDNWPERAERVKDQIETVLGIVDVLKLRPV